MASAEILAQEVPIGLPRVSAGGPDPDRILLFGSDVFMGRGVLSHDLALPGQLARAVSAITGRGIDVQLHTRPSMLIAEAIHAIDEVNLESYDAVLISIGLTDAMASTRPAEWKQRLAALMTKLESGITSSSHVFILKRPTSTTAPRNHRRSCPRRGGRDPSTGSASSTALAKRDSTGSWR